jgi:hypothetical protein
MNLMSIFGGGGGRGCDPEFYDCGEDLPGGGGIPVYGWVNVIENRGDWTQIGTLSPLSPPDIGGPPTLPPNLCGPICIQANPPSPPPPPGYEDCKKALAMNGKNFGNLQNALDNWNNIQNAANLTGVDPNIIAAIAYGHGYGVFQFDNRYNSGETLFVALDFPAAAAMIVGQRIASSTASNLANGASSEVALAGAIRAYNAGQSSTNPFINNVPGYVNLDIGTTGQDYVSQVLAIAQNCFH